MNEYMIDDVTINTLASQSPHIITTCMQEISFFELEQILCSEHVVRMTWHCEMILIHER